MRELTYSHRSANTKAPSIRVRVYKNLEELSLGAAEIFVNCSIEQSKKKGRFTVVLSGGKTPEKLYKILCSDDFKRKVPWVDTHLFWGDERCVNASHPKSNYLMVERALLSCVTIPPENIHPICGELKEDATLLYEEEIENFFDMTKSNICTKMPTFDLVLLGLGNDGHILSLFPGSNALGATNRMLIHVYAQGVDIEERATMTIPLINRASKIVFLVSGENKSAKLLATLEGKYDPRHLPAHGLNPDNGEILYLVDEAAAGLLTASG